MVQPPPYSEPSQPAAPYPGAPYPGTPSPGTPYPGTPYPGTPQPYSGPPPTRAPYPGSLEGEPMYPVGPYPPVDQFGRPYPAAPYPTPYPGPFGYPGYGAPPPASPVSQPVLGWALLGCVALILLAALLPWATVYGQSIAGTNGDGSLTIVCAAAVAVLGLLMGLRQGRLWTAVLAAVFGALTAVIAVVDLADVSHVAAGETEVFGNTDIHVGTGLWLTLVAGLAALAVAIIAMLRRSQPGTTAR